MGPLPLLAGGLFSGLLAGRWSGCPGWAVGILAAACLGASALLTWKGRRASWWLMLGAAFLLGGFLGARSGHGGPPGALPPLPPRSVLRATALADETLHHESSALRVRIEGGTSHDGVTALDEFLHELHARDPGCTALLAIGRGGCGLLEGQQLLIRAARTPPRRGYLNPGVPSRRGQRTVVLEVSDCGQVLVVDRDRPAFARARSRLAAAQADTLHPVVAGLATAVTTGRQQHVARGVRDAFRQTGTAHVMAISGLHLALVVLAVFGCVRRLWALSQRACHLVAAQHAACAAALACTWTFAFFASARPPVVRAAVMVSVVILARLLGRSTSGFVLLAAAAVVILVADPAQAVSASFLLSFSAVAGILVGAPRIRALLLCSATATDDGGPVLRLARGCVRWLVTAGSVSLAAGVCTWPASILLFGSAAPLGPLLNVLAVPLFSLLFLPAALLHAVLLALGPHLGGAFAPVVHAAAWPLLLVVSTASRVPSVHLDGDAALLAAAGLAAAFLLLAFGRRRLAVVVVAAVVLAATVRVAGQRLIRDERLEGLMTVVFLDVGQGDAAYVRTPGGGHLLVDAGPAHPGAGRDAPVPAFLRAWGVDALDTVVVSHPHADHFGGLADLVAARVPVTEIVAGAPPGDGGADEGYDAVLETMEEAGTRLRGPPACGPLRLAGTTARVVHPCGDVAGLDANDLSLTMLICHREVCVLFTGDIGRRVEGRLARMDEVQRASLLKVPHHGSRYSTSRALASLERLRWAVVSCRAGNSHGFPHPEPMKRLSGAGVRVLRIDRRGAWIAVTDGRSLALFDHRWRRP